LAACPGGTGRLAGWRSASRIAHLLPIHWRAAANGFFGGRIWKPFLRFFAVFVTRHHDFS